MVQNDQPGTVDRLLADSSNSSHRHPPHPGDRNAIREAERLTLMEAEARFQTCRRFPLVRVSLVRMDEDDHMLLITIHHTVFGWDGRSES